MSKFYPLTVSDIKRETPNAVSISFEIPENLQVEFQFKAGQYITIKHELNGEEVRRAYSICCTPNTGLLKVGVKKVATGTFSVFANETLQVGDTLQVMPPQGHFVIEPNTSTKRDYAFFAAGSGITPVLSLITTILEKETQSRVVLAYGNRNLEETMFHSELLQLLEQYSDRFYIEFIYSRKQEGEAMFGRIERSTVNYLLKNKFGDRKFDAFYLCGPEPMIDTVSSVLKESGYNEKQIFFELFTTSEEGLLTETHDGMTQVTVILDEETETFTMSQDTSVLEAAMKANLDPPYSCQGGICSTCIARLKEGKVEMRKNQILTDEELAEGFILTCQSHPSTPTIVVDYDDV
ncbi:ferredoxin--NADP reductase [Flavobacteriaceae bacterium TK19130]|nr:ferredoxin--NADP reductase [Thermobacterium salinum]